MGSELKSYNNMEEEDKIFVTQIKQDVIVNEEKTLGKEDAAGSDSAFGSYQNFHSQVELCPNSFTPNNNEKKGDDAEIESPIVKEYTGIKRYVGMLLILISSLLLTFVNLMAKVLQNYEIDAFSISFARYVGIAVPAIPIVIMCEWLSFFKAETDKGAKESVEKVSIFRTVWPVFKNDNWKTWIGLLSRGLVGSSAAILRFFAYQYLTIGDTAVITYSQPILVNVMAHYCLGERCGVIPVIISLTTLVGVVIVTKPPLLTGAESYDHDTLIGVSLAVASLICSAFMVILTRKIREVHFSVMLLVFGAVGIIQAVVMVYTLGDGGLDLPTQLVDSLLIGGVALFSFLGQFCYILGVKFEQAGPVALIRSCDVIFSFIIQFIFLSVVPDYLSVIGATIVLSGVVIIASRKWISTLPDDRTVKKYFGWILY